MSNAARRVERFPWQRRFAWLPVWLPLWFGRDGGQWIWLRHYEQRRVWGIAGKWWEYRV